MSAMPVQKICVVTALAMLAAFFFCPVVVFAQIVPPSFDEAPVKAVPAQPAPLQPIPVGGVQAPAALQTAPEMGQTREDLVVMNAVTVLEQFMRLPTKRIPGPSSAMRKRSQSFLM